MTRANGRAVERLAMDFRRWGKAATKRVERGTKKYGVCFSWYFENGTG